MKVHLKIDLPQPMTGAQIAALVKKVAGQEFFQEIDLVDDEGVHYEIGVDSQYPRDLVIAVDEPDAHTLLLTKTYACIYVVYKKRKGAETHHDQRDIIREMTEFHQKLQQEVETLSDPPDESLNGRMIEFDWKDKHYKVGKKAYDLNKIVLPDGTLLEGIMWFDDSNPPQLEELQEHPHPYKGRKSAEEIAKMFDGIVAESVE